MEAVLSMLIGLFFAAGVYLMMSRQIVRILLGVAIFGNAVNLLIFTAGRLTRAVPPVIPIDELVPPTATANPLPQALILTAIVIGFSVAAYLTVLLYRIYVDSGTATTPRLERIAGGSDGLDDGVIR